MSDYCTTYPYEPKKRLGQDACPFNTLYWNFLIQHEQILRSNLRMGPNVLCLNRIGAEERLQIQEQANKL